MPRTRALSVATLAIAASALASRSAANQHCNHVSIPAAATDWSSSVTIPKFDPSQGVLTGIYFWIDATAIGSAQFESLDRSPTVVSLAFASHVTLERPDHSAIVVAGLAQFLFDAASAYDGATDFGGTSGKTYANLSVFQSADLASPPASDFALFTGPAGNPGTIALPVRAINTSSGSGAEHLALQFLQLVKANVSVCYTWSSDCNLNGIPDEQDLASGASLDANHDGALDECEAPILRICQGDGPSNGGPDCPCGNVTPGSPAGCLNSTGLGGLLDASGNASVSNDTLLLSATQLPPLVPGYFFQGTQANGGGPGTPFGAGLICVGGSVIRMAKIVSSPQFGTMELPFQGDPPLSQQFSIAAGSTRFYQVWYRNNGGPCGLSFNTTNGLRILWSN